MPIWGIENKNKDGIAVKMRKVESLHCGDRGGKGKSVKSDRLLWMELRWAATLFSLKRIATRARMPMNNTRMIFYFSYFFGPFVVCASDCRRSFRIGRCELVFAAPFFSFPPPSSARIENIRFGSRSAFPSSTPALLASALWCRLIRSTPTSFTHKLENCGMYQIKMNEILLASPCRCVSRSRKKDFGWHLLRRMRDGRSICLSNFVIEINSRQCLSLLMYYLLMSQSAITAPSFSGVLLFSVRIRHIRNMQGNKGIEKDFVSIFSMFFAF